MVDPMVEQIPCKIGEEKNDKTKSDITYINDSVLLCD